jgi:CRP-like cAMP-binding protein
LIQVKSNAEGPRRRKRRAEAAVPLAFPGRRNDIGSAVMDIRGLLRQTEFFKDISEKSVTSLAGICIPKTVEKRAFVFLEGQEGHSMYILAEGAVQLFKSTPEGREVVIKTMKPGEIFGEVILFEQAAYPVSAVALRRSVLLRVPKVQIDCLLAADSFRRDFIGMLMRKQRYLTERILFLTSHDVEERFFLFLEEQYGRREEYTITLSKRDFAAAIGTIPETFSRLLLRLREQGILRWEGRTLTLPRGFWERRAT